jgi:hypothetical protein
VAVAAEASTGTSQPEVPARPAAPVRRAGAVAAAFALIAIGASGCGEDLKRAVDSARSVQQQGSNALTQAEQQARSVEDQLQQQAPQGQGGSGGGNYGY